MPRRTDLHKILVIGSGPIIIGQAAEFDYAGTQACTALKEEGMRIVLVNSNPATIMTDRSMAHSIYLEPLTVDYLQTIIATERPDCLLPTLGGQVGLNLAIDLDNAGVLDQYNVEVLGTGLSTIRQAEDRHEFKCMLADIGEPVPASSIATTLQEALAFAGAAGYPVVVRPAYTLGGTGGGIARTSAQLRSLASLGIKLSPINQILVEQYLDGCKEIEYEVVRDGHGTCVVVCNMENIDPMGIHTGDSIVVAPSLTLTQREHQMLRSSAIRIVTALGIEGGCNVQFALSPHRRQYYVIEVNPRVSRSSALASKATGYPIARIATKIALGYHLHELPNPITNSTFACFEPAIDYVVVKYPRWSFDKLPGASRTLGTQMKATGEVMSIGRSLEEALHKAVRSLEIDNVGMIMPEHQSLTTPEVMERISECDDERLFLIATALDRGVLPSTLATITGIAPFFITKLHNIITMRHKLTQCQLTRELLLSAKQMGFSDQQIAELQNSDPDHIRQYRIQSDIKPTFKMVDTCAGEFAASTPYYYSTYDQEDEVHVSNQNKTLVLGSGPIRIGQGIEFDYCSVQAVHALRELGLGQTIIINNNPETVSTDFNTADRLYFEPLHLEDVLNVIQREQVDNVIAQFGGQTAINLALPLHDHGVNILGTQVSNIQAAEDRHKFDNLIADLDIPRPPGRTVTEIEPALAIAAAIGYPVLVRPSFVLGGRAMELVDNPDDLRHYMIRALKASSGQPILIDKYIAGREIEVDAVCDGENVLIPAILEHVEQTGIHSGDSIAICPPRNISAEAMERIVDYTTRLSLALQIKGLINIQYVLIGDDILIIEANPRASRTIPFISKITGIPLVHLATAAICGKDLPSQGYQSGLVPPPTIVAAKAPVFSWAKLHGVDTYLGPEMRSTGEVIGVGDNLHEALYKAFAAMGFASVLGDPDDRTALVTVADRDKHRLVPIIRKLVEHDFTIYATAGTCDYLTGHSLPVSSVHKIGSGSPDVLELITQGTISLVINTFTRGRTPERDGFRIRRAASESGIPCLSSLDTALAFIEAIDDEGSPPRPINITAAVRTPSD